MGSCLLNWTHTTASSGAPWAHLVFLEIPPDHPQIDAFLTIASISPLALTRLSAAHWDLLCKQDTIVSMALHPPGPHPPAPGSTPAELFTAWRMKPTPAGIPGLRSLAQFLPHLLPKLEAASSALEKPVSSSHPLQHVVGSSHDQEHGASVGSPNPGLPTALCPRALAPPSWSPRLFIRVWVRGLVK